MPNIRATFFGAGADGISIKLSALHSHYHQTRLLSELLPRVEALAVAARAGNMGFNIDAEEAERLDISLDIFEALTRDPKLNGWDGLGFVLQAYQKRAPGGTLPGRNRSPALPGSATNWLCRAVEYFFVSAPGTFPWLFLPGKSSLPWRRGTALSPSRPSRPIGCRTCRRVDAHRGYSR